MTYSPSKRFARVLGAALLSLAAASAALALPIATIDQQNPGPFTGTSGLPSQRSFGQSFTAGLGAVDAFDFLLGGFETQVILRVRDGLAGFDGLAGNILAESAPVAVDQLGSHWFHFDLPHTLALQVGKTYVAELFIASDSLGVRMTVDNSYTGGQMLTGGFAPDFFSTDYDLVFAEGIHAAVPEPSAVLMMAIGVAAVLGWRVRRHHGAPRR
jgi:hypothetical protein